MVVIFAGYTNKMEVFLKRNPGLRSRVSFHVKFDDYDTESLCEIAKLIAKQKSLVLTDDAVDKLRDIFDTVRTEEDFGNGRLVRTIIEQAKMTQATRLLSLDLDTITKKDIETIVAEDIKTPISTLTTKRIQVGF